MCDFQNATRRNALTSVRKLQAFISGLSVRATHVIRIEKKRQPDIMKKFTLIWLQIRFILQNCLFSRALIGSFLSSIRVDG